MAKKLLVVTTNTAYLTLTDGEKYPSGVWAEEFAVPYELFKKAGYSIDVATLGGIAPTVDKSSLDPNGMMKWVRPSFVKVDDAAESARYKKTIENADAFRSPKDLGKISQDDIAGSDGIYIAGGHGCMEDFPASPPMTKFLLTVLQMDKPLASLCHGPTAFLSPRDMAGESPFSGYRMTCFSHVEEFYTKVNGKIPMVLELEVKRLGMQYSKGPYPWCSHVVVDRNLVTGQNPFSSAEVGKQFLELLARQ